MKKIIRYAILIILIAYMIFFRFADQIGFERGPEDRFRVMRIIDGDTFELEGGDLVRLIGIDSPERGEPYYDSARILLESIILNKNINLEYSQKRRDGYGRLLGYAYIDSFFINGEIVRRGFAYVYLFRDNIRDTSQIYGLLNSQNNAINDRIGLWSIERNPEPYYLANPDSYRFHRPGCNSIKADRLNNYLKFESRIEAFERGYSPCRNCKP
ncbi:MAG: thermonuclease family protein [Candidatus Zixiibacteriota bacterium]